MVVLDDVFEEEWLFLSQLIEQQRLLVNCVEQELLGRLLVVQSGHCKLAERQVMTWRSNRAHRQGAQRKGRKARGSHGLRRRQAKSRSGLERGIAGSDGQRPRSQHIRQPVEPGFLSRQMHDAAISRKSLRSGLRLEGRDQSFR